MPKKNKLKIFAGLIGVILIIFGWLFGNLSEYPLIKKIVIPKHSIAISTLDKMNKEGFILKRGERGFSEISELFEYDIELESEDSTDELQFELELLSDIANWNITKIETLKSEIGIGHNDKVTRCLTLRIFSDNAQTHDFSFENPRDWIEDRYNTDVVFCWATCFFWLGVIVSVICVFL